MNHERCEQCRFCHTVWRAGDPVSSVNPEKGTAFHGNREEDFMLCRKSPPVVIHINNCVNSAWPLVHPDDWCGEFGPKVTQ